MHDGDHVGRTGRVEGAPEPAADAEKRSRRAARSGNGAPAGTRTPDDHTSLNGEAREILRALHALRRGDQHFRLPLEWTGMAGRIADAFNDVADMNARLTAEPARLSRVVGKEGKLRQRATLGPVPGSWSETIESTNSPLDDPVYPTSEVARRS